MKTKAAKSMEKTRESRKALGLVRYEGWCKPEHKEQIKRFAKKLTGGEK
jgi:hypothetical protein